MKNLNNFATAIASGAIGLVIVAVAWQAAAMAVRDPLLMPALPAVLTRLGQLLISGSFWGEAAVTVQHFVLGYVPALIGIPLGLALAAVMPLRFIFGGLVNGMAAAPLIASVPLLTSWLGIGDGAKIALVFVVAFFALTSEVMTGLARRASSAGAGDEAPGTARCIIAALRRSFVLAVTAALVGELVASTHGLGFVLMNSMMSFDFPQTAAVLLATALPCAIVVAVVRGVEELV